MRTAVSVGGALRGRPARSLLTVAGIAGTTLLVLVLLAAHRSLSAGVNAYAGQPGIDLWVTPPGTDNLIRSSGFLPPSAEEEIRSLPGVAAADPLLRSFVTVSLRGARDRSGKEGGSMDDARLTMLAVGYAAPAGLGGPPSIASGRAPRRENEVVLDRAAAHRLGVTPGDTILVNDRATAVSGLSRGTNLLATQFLFGAIDDARSARQLPGRSSFLAVRLASGADPAAVASRMRKRMPGVGVYDRRTFVDNNLREVASGVRPLLALIAALGLAVATVLVLLLVQGVVEDRRADIAVLLALGAGASSIGIGVVGRAALQVLVGGVTGGILAIGLGQVLDRTMPSVELSHTAGGFLLVLALFLVAGSAAAALPVLRVRRIDPLEAFRP